MLRKKRGYLHIPGTLWYKPFQINRLSDLIKTDNFGHHQDGY